MKTRARVTRSFLIILPVLIALSGSLLAQPSITSLSFSPPTTVTTNGASASVTINFSLTGQGVYYFATALADPSGSFISHEIDKSLVPANSITNSVAITLPPFSPAGTWRVAYAFALDANGFVFLNSADAVTAAFPNLGALTVTSTADTAAPQITAFSLTPGTIDTTAASTTVNVGFTLTDDLSGASSFQVLFTSPSGSQTQFASKTFTAATSVTSSVPVTFPRFSEPGTWTVANVVLGDAVGNTSFLATSDLAAKGFPTTLTVTSTPDTTPPTLTALSFSPTSITTVGSPVTVTYGATDDLSGVNSVSILLTSPTGGQQQTGASSVSPPATPAAGTISLNFPGGTEQGTWTVSLVLVSDAAGNTKSYKPTCNVGDPPSLCTSLGGFPSTFIVNPPGADTTPPIITPTVSPLPNGAGWNNTVPVTVTWTVVDPESGIASQSTGCGTTVLNAQTPGTVVTCSATNGAGLSGSASVLVKIDTSAPVTSNAVATPDPVIINTDVTITATVTDTGGSHVASAEFQVDGGPFDDLTGAFGTDSVNVSLTLPGSATPLLQTPGVHNICVRGTDFASNQGAVECVLFAVYDPTGGFATGGGGANSPAGADPSNPNVSGPVTFAFNPKYLPNNPNVPQGDFEFHFNADNINFKSTGYDFLVVTNGNRAQAQGTGTINGSTVCKFSIDAWNASFQPGNVDAFGLTIFNCGGGTGNRYVLPTGPITKGSIKIHQ